MIKVTVTDANVVDAFNRLLQMSEQPTGPLKAIGEALIEFTKTRFELSEDPYGNPWLPNSTTTVNMALHRSSKNFKKNGELSAQGARVVAGKKPLIGETKALSTQFGYRVLDYQVAVSSSMIYAALQNFGGTVVPKTAKALFFMVGDQKVVVKSVTIPARPFFPNEQQGIPDELAKSFSEILEAAILGALNGGS